MSTLLTKTTRRGKTIVITLTQEENQDRISITVDGEPLELDEDAVAGRPVSLGAKMEKNMGLEPGAVSFGTAVLTGREYETMNQAWSEQSPRYRAELERILNEKRQVQARKEEIETALQQANEERDNIPDDPPEGEEPEEHQARIARAEQKIDRAAAALREFEASQKPA